MNDVSDGDREPIGRPRYTRRLSDEILVGFHHACDQGDFEVAWRLLQLMERTLRRPPALTGSNRPRRVDGLVAAHERLWQLRHPTQD